MHRPSHLGLGRVPAAGPALHAGTRGVGAAIVLGASEGWRESWSLAARSVVVAPGDRREYMVG